jgi:hypothetical protein
MASRRQRAEIYEGQLVPAILRPWASVLVQKANLTSGQSALDLACGTGVVARHASSAVDESGVYPLTQESAELITCIAKSDPASPSKMSKVSGFWSTL